jgi:translation initiation factor eIF-2B subunit delta
MNLAAEKIKDGDTVLTYARSSIVEKVLLQAHKSGRDFRVIVIDSRPLLEGKNLLRTLTEHGVPTTYAALPSLGALISTVDLILLGTHALHSNGALYSRAGCALVAMLAKARNIPVLVCCETYKFYDGVALDGLGKNELGPTGPPSSDTHFPTTSKHITHDAGFYFPSQQQQQQNQQYQTLNPLYDLTPAANITAVVTEIGLIPPNSVPTVLGRLNASYSGQAQGGGI